MITEIWINISASNGLYQISNAGRVRKAETGKTAKYRILTNHRNQHYYYTTLRISGISKNFLIHRLVAEAFISNPRLCKYVNHIDGDKLNNSISNLEWCTHQENCQHAARIGLIKSKSITQFSLTGKSIKIWRSLKDIQRAGFNAGNIRQVAIGNRRKADGFIWKYSKKEAI